MATIAMDPPDVEAPLRCARSRSNISESQSGFVGSGLATRRLEGGRDVGLRAATARDAVTAAVDEMSPILPVFLLIASLSTAYATCDPAALYDPTYAADAAGKGGVEVSRWLHLRTSAFHEPVSYTAAWNALEASIDSHNASHMRVIYGGTAPKCRTGAYYGLECAWNREHLWPQSYGVGESSGLTAAAAPRTDLHALVPSLKALNSARSNRAFAQITDWPNDDGRCGPKYVGCETPACTKTTCGVRGTAQWGTDPGFWTPPAMYRGFIARALFYMAVRYDGDEPNTFNLTLGETPAKGGGGPGLEKAPYVFGALSHLLRWHDDHPVEAWERARNDAACAVQGNRNPFTDKPELAAVVFGGVGTAAEADTSDAGKGFDTWTWSLVTGLGVMWALYIFGMFRWFV